MAVADVEIEGLEALNRALRELAPKLTAEAEAGIFEGGFIIQAQAQRNAPREYGDLFRSAYTRKDGRNTRVGFDEAYALYVHENMESETVGAGIPRPSGLGTYWNPGGPRFLARAVDEKAPDVLAVVERRLAGKMR